MKMKVGRLSGWFLGLGVAATVGPSIQYVNIVFNPLARWLILLVLFFIVVASGRVLAGLRGVTGLFAVSLLLYAVMTTVWSPVPALTGPKSLAFLLVAISYSAAGAVWAETASQRSVLNIIWPIVILTLLAGFGGAGLSSAQVRVNEAVELYRGLAFNSNFLGILVLVALPLPLWLLSQSDLTKRAKRIQFGILAALAYMLLSTFSRASILGAAIMGLIYLIGQGATRLFLAFTALIVVVTTVPLLFPEWVNILIVQYVYKGDVVQATIMTSRLSVWSESYEAAVEGGVFGLGYGVSYGYDAFTAGISASSYGREKGNVSLAIIEEVGLFGYALFLGMMLTILITATRAALKATQREDRVLLTLLIGSVLALLANAHFEAWLFSPGGAATPVFWATLGIMATVTRRVLNEQSSNVVPLQLVEWAEQPISTVVQTRLAQTKARA